LSKNEPSIDCFLNLLINSGFSLEDSDNKTIRYFMIGGLIIFILTFIYSEKIKEPTAGRQATVFKRLQLANHKRVLMD
jgi:hypothetical protein